MSTLIHDTDDKSYRAKILVADDNEDFLEVLQIFLRQYNKFDIDIARTGKEVVEKVNTTCYDVVILDVKFPDVLGTTIGELLKKYDPLLNVGFLTGYVGSATLEAVDRIHAKYWIKPIEDINGLAQDIYQMALEHPCNGAERTEKRKEAQIRLKARKDAKDFIEIPKVLLEASKGVDRGRTEQSRDAA